MTKPRSFPTELLAATGLASFAASNKATVSDPGKALNLSNYPIEGIATANGGLLVGLPSLTLEGKTLVVTEGQTLSDVAAAFAQVVIGATVAELAVANGDVKGFFKSGQVLTVPSYVVQAKDTLAGIAANVGETGDHKVLQLIIDNDFIPNLFPPQLPLRYGMNSIEVVTGNSFFDLSNTLGMSYDTIAAYNGTLAFPAGQTLDIPYAMLVQPMTGTYASGGNESLQAIANRILGAQTADPNPLALLNAELPGLFAAIPITLGTASHTPTSSDSFASIAIALGVSLTELVAAIAPVPGLFRPEALFFTPALSTISSDITLDILAARLRATSEELAIANAATTNLIKSGARLWIGKKPFGAGPYETFASLQARFDVDIAVIVSENPSLPIQAGIPLLPPVRQAVAVQGLVPQWSSAIMPLQVTATITRPALVDPEFSGMPDVRSVDSLLTAKPYAQAEDDDVALSLKTFAADLETAIPGLKLATGPSPKQAGAPATYMCGSTASGATRTDAPTDGTLAGTALWAVNFGQSGLPQQRFNFTVQGKGTRFFAISPLSTKLWQGTAIEVPYYTAGTGFGGITPTMMPLNFQNLDMDALGLSYLDALDQFLQPEMAAVVYAIDPALLDGAVSAKRLLADGIVQQIDAVFGDQSVVPSDPGLIAASAKLRQQLLNGLGNGYRTSSIVQTPVTVTAGCSCSTTAAQLLGKPIARMPSTSAAGDDLPSLAKRLGVGSAYIVAVFEQMPNLLQVDTVVTYASAPSKQHTIVENDTLSQLMSIFETDNEEAFANNVSTLEHKPLFRPSIVLGVTVLNDVVPAATTNRLTLLQLAKAVGSDVVGLILANQDVHLFTGQMTIAGTSVTVHPDDTPLTLAAQFITPAGIPYDLTGLATALFAADCLEQHTGTVAYTLAPGAAIVVFAVAPAASFTTGTLPLSTDGSFITTLLNLKIPALSRSVSFDLDFEVSHLEFSRLRNPAIFGDYEDSSWLNFIIALVPGAPTLQIDSRIGLQTIPAPLRAYPATPVITAQRAVSDIFSLDKPVPTWSYQMKMRRDSAAQDSYELDLQFNVADMTTTHPRSQQLAQSPYERLFRRLAGFAHIQHDLLSDVASIAAGALSAEATKSVVQAFVWMANSVAAAWSLPMTAKEDDDGGAAISYTYKTSTLLAPKGDTLAMLEIAVTAPPGYPIVWPEIEDVPTFFFNVINPAASIGDLYKGYVDNNLCQQFAANNRELAPKTTKLTKVDNDAYFDNATDQIWIITDDQGPPQQSRAFRLRATVDGQLTVDKYHLWPLGAGFQVGSGQRAWFCNMPIGQTNDVVMSFHQLDPMVFESAWGGDRVQRNAALVPGRGTNDAFIYTTPMMHFPNKVRPSLTDAAETDLHQFTKLNNPTLTECLSGFFTYLVEAQAKHDPTSARLIKVTATAGSRIHTGDDTNAPVYTRIPLTYTSSYGFDVTHDPNPQLTNSFVVRLATAVVNQAAVSGIPAATPRRYYFDVTAFAQGSAPINPGTPLLRMSNLYFDVPSQPTGVQ